MRAELRRHRAETALTCSSRVGGRVGVGSVRCPRYRAGSGRAGRCRVPACSANFPFGRNQPKKPGGMGDDRRFGHRSDQGCAAGTAARPYSRGWPESGRLTVHKLGGALLTARRTEPVHRPSHPCRARCWLAATPSLQFRPSQLGPGRRRPGLRLISSLAGRICAVRYWVRRPRLHRPSAGHGSASRRRPGS